MKATNWDRKVFRLRRIPASISTADEAAKLLATALQIDPSEVVIGSIGRIDEISERFPSKVATLQLKQVPACIRSNSADEEWHFPVPGQPTASPLLLDTHFGGWTALNTVDPSTHHADVIALSGLGSHPFGSWQPRGNDKTFMWLRDALPASIPGVRSFIYGYDSKVLASHSFQSISDISTSFILALKNGGWNLNSKKPIIFIAHSLGGIVLKDACVQIAEAREATTACILNNIQGAIMFGVPSLGMEQSHLLAMVEGQANETLVQDLSRGNGNNYLRQLRGRFDGICFTRQARIVWAYETVESPTIRQMPDQSWDRNGPREVLVNPDSATSYYNRKDKASILPINENHSNMVKFSSGNPNLGSILVLLREICASTMPMSGHFSDVEGSALADQDRDFTKSSAALEDATGFDDRAITDVGKLLSEARKMHGQLYSPELDFRVHQIEDPFQSTFQWIFQTPTFCDWLQNDDFKLLWIHGKPGSGKSTLMKHVLESKQTWELLHDWRRPSEIVCSFFLHLRGTALQKSFEGVLRSLIIQILAPHRLLMEKKFQHILQKYRILTDHVKELTIQKEQKQVFLTETNKSIVELKTELILSQAEKTSRGFSENDEKIQLNQSLLEIHEESRKEAEFELKSFAESSSNTLSNLQYILRIAKRLQYSQERILLSNVIEEFKEHHEGSIHRLERVLRFLVDQDIIQMDLTLFFDALDEFDGHINLISRFIRSLVDGSKSSATRIKVCFSSRPWESLQRDFVGFPSISLQEHTATDIENYTIGSLIASSAADPLVLDLVPTIVDKANGVFLWVKLTIREILRTASVYQNQPRRLREELHKALSQVPSDLQDYYELIISRISISVRRYTFALLELLIRPSIGPPMTAKELRDAVIVSHCSTPMDVSRELSKIKKASNTFFEREQVKNDINIWSGGLVEIVSGEDQDLPQLMHQTVAEFTMALAFKQIVLGGLSTFINDNGHSFRVKYWISSTLVDESRRAELQQLVAHHAQLSEHTTGHSQIKFIQELPSTPFYKSLSQQIQYDDPSATIVAFMASSGLALCLRDWVSEHQGDLSRLSRGYLNNFLLRNHFLSSPSVPFDNRLPILRLLLENGFDIKRELFFFEKTLFNAWDREAVEAIESHESSSALHEGKADLLYHNFAAEFLKHKQDPNVVLDVWWAGTAGIQVSPLHIASPSIAEMCIQCGAETNACDSAGRTPLDWFLQYPDEVAKHKPPIEDRYKMCLLLIQAGGLASRWDETMWLNALLEFEAEGFDTTALREHFETQKKKNTGLFASIFKLGWVK
ncbi:unnamed protein product [Clonostachys byssicola]|uniref:Nephrocystin 3-like N-terminal domain-containing protein n=1 Tax=Clonostachys byssicola TaxID=160290 RepID=A0A9N9UZ14_9HYPO|nr:unnamed protein product [Clonostachys byssicola]